jgi:hypothetical protein
MESDLEEDYVDSYDGDFVMEINGAAMDMDLWSQPSDDDEEILFRRRANDGAATVEDNVAGDRSDDVTDRPPSPVSGSVCWHTTTEDSQQLS